MQAADWQGPASCMGRNPQRQNSGRKRVGGLEAQRRVESSRQGQEGSSVRRARSVDCYGGIGRRASELGAGARVPARASKRGSAQAAVRGGLVGCRAGSGEESEAGRRAGRSREGCVHAERGRSAGRAGTGVSERRKQKETPSNRRTIETWLILPVVICLSQRLSHACSSIASVQ